MNNQTIELKFGTPTPIYYNDPNYGKIQFLIRGIFKCNAVDQNINVDEINNVIVTNANVWISEVIQQNQNVEYEKLPEITKNYLSQKVVTVLPNNLQFVGLDKFELNLTNESLAIVNSKKVTVVDTAAGSQNGQTKCPKCGATEITPIGEGGKLKCNFCRHEFEPEKVAGLDGNIAELQGKVIGSGAQDIDTSFDGILTLKCTSCGAEVVIDTNEVTNARCHWCRNTLSINQKIPNGSVPDVVLPFYIKKEDARKAIEEFVNKRKFFANTKFKQEFKTDNILGVYFPYMIVDVNAHCKLMGQGEHLIRRYTVKVGDSSHTYYDADLYNVEREFDIEIDDLTIEGSADKLNKTSSENTNNVINAIMPFDLMNAVKWDANYLKGYSSEKRDINISDIQPLAETQSKDIARFAANDSLQFYDRGVRWANEYIDVKGQQWKSAYLPVWLYSYQEVKGDKKVLHYVAVNGRTKEVMGSVPINIPKLVVISALVEMLGVFLMMTIEFEFNWIFLALGIIYFLVIYSKYRNKDARHRHEIETRRKVDNLRQVDDFVQSRKRLSNSRIDGANNNSVQGVGEIANLINEVKDNIK